MSTIKAQIERIKAEKQGIKDALTEKGITCTDEHKLAHMGELIGGINSNKLYICTAVDKLRHTWSGQEAILMGDDSYRYYNFSDVVTEGMTYTSVNPAIGEGWDEKCCMRMNSIWQGISTTNLVLYGMWGNGGMPGIQWGHAAMNINISSGICSASETCNQVTVARYKNVTGISQSKLGYSGNKPMTIATWYRDIGKASNTLLLGYGAKSSNRGLFLCTHNGKAAYSLGGTIQTTDIDVTDMLHHLCLVHTGTQVGLYVDGELVKSTTATSNFTDSPFYFGGNISGTAGSITGFSNLDGYIVHSYVYAQALNDFTIRALANEVWPKDYRKVNIEMTVDNPMRVHVAAMINLPAGTYLFEPSTDTDNRWICFSPLGVSGIGTIDSLVIDIDKDKVTLSVNLGTDYSLEVPETPCVIGDRAMVLYDDELTALWSKNPPIMDPATVALRFVMS